MSKFIKLTNLILNTNDIHRIVIHPSKYVIHIVSKKIDGFNWIICGFGLGNISSYVNEIEVCEKQHLTDYKIVSEWIRKN
jgi:hypothetical protein